MNGYGHPKYAESLAEFGEPRRLTGAGGSVLLRSIPGTPWRDAMGTYPLFCCSRWESLADDLHAMSSDAISASLVADPFGGHDDTLLAATFHVVLEYKPHYVIDFSKPYRPRPRHRDYARQALRRVQVDLVSPGGSFREDWRALYHHLTGRHRIGGIRAFSNKAFDLQLATPGVVAFRASLHGRTIAGHLWYVSGDVAYSHLLASSEAGYDLRAAYALHDAAIEHFRASMRWVTLGGGTGLKPSSDGLVRFKSGWANATRTVKFCGRILDAGRYRAAVEQHGLSPRGYFPAYRSREFA
jgi:hypothetical protein